MEQTETSRKNTERGGAKPRIMQNIRGHTISEKHALCTRHAIQEYFGVERIFRLGFTTP
jgi:hypothetical protein